MLRSTTRLRGISSGINALLRSVSANRVQFTVPDLFRICALLKDGEDTLGLRSQQDFLHALAIQYKRHSENTDSPISPFQDALLRETLTPFVESAHKADTAEHNSNASATGNTGTRRLSSHAEPTAAERVNAIWEILDETRRESPSELQNDVTDSHAPSSAFDVSGNAIQQMEVHITALEKQLRQLSPSDVNRLIKALAVANYTNYRHTSLLARRGCEIVTDLPLSEVCKLYFNLNRLNTRDSLQPIVNRILTQVTELDALEVYIVAQSLERQAHTSPASATLIVSLAKQGAGQVAEAPSPSYHRALLAAMARYDLKHHPAIPTLLNDLVDRVDCLSARDLLAILQSLCELGSTAAGGAGPTVASPTCLRSLLRRTVEVVPSVDIRSIDTWMDVLSYLPADTSAAMEAVMARLDSVAGSLSLPQLDFSLRLLSTYPPAKGHVCVVSLAFAGSLRAESMEPRMIESILVSLALLHLFTDDFYTLASILQAQKGGFRKLESLFTAAENYSQTKAAKADPRFVSLVHDGVCALAPTLTDGELTRCRQLLRQLGIADRDITQKVLSRARQLQRGPGSGKGSWGGARAPPVQSQGSSIGSGSSRGGRKKRKPYDPMADLLE